MAERKKLEIPLNQPLNLELLYNEPVTGQSQFGDYFLYCVRNGGPQEYSFFAPQEVHEKIKVLHKGDKFEIIKTAEQKGSKILTRYEVKAVQINNKTEQKQQEELPGSKDNYYNILYDCYKDVLKLQEHFPMIQIEKAAITLFIARSKINGNGYGE